MEFKDVIDIYEKKKSLAQGSYNFIRGIFEEVEKRYKEDARKRSKDPQMAWNSWSGKNLQKLLSYIIKDFVLTKYNWVGITSDEKLRGKKLSPELDKVKRNLLVFYKNHGVVPDADIVIFDKKTFEIIAVLSCKASLRERVAQAAYWKLKLLANKSTEGILCFLVSTDKDGDFSRTGEKISRNRIIVEFGELDGAWILRDIPESSKIKKFNHIFNDLTKIIINRKG